MKKIILIFLLVPALISGFLCLTGCSKSGTYAVDKITKTTNSEVVVLELKDYDDMTASEKILADIYKDRVIEINKKEIKFLINKEDKNAKSYNFKIEKENIIFDDELMNNAGIKYTYVNGKIYLTFEQLNSKYEIEFKMT